MKKTHFNRWVYAAFGVVVLLFAGMVYAWSVLSTPIAKEFPQWTKAELSMTFTIVMILFCLGCLAGGIFSARLSARTSIWLCGVLHLLGFAISASTQGLWMLYLGFGVLCGFGSGLAYNAVMGSVGKWFPDKQGLISGILLMGFGLSSFLVGKLFQACTPETTGAWRTSFLVFGIISAAALIFCGCFIRKPEPGEVTVTGKKKTGCVSPVAMEAPTKVMMGKASFWLYYLWAILLSAAGLAIVSQASGIAGEAGSALAAGTIATIVGLLSIANGVGRVILGGLYDRLGRSVVMQSVNLLFILAGIVLAVAMKSGSVALLVVGFLLGGLAYGGVSPTNSAFVSSYFGMKHYPVNFSVVNTNLILASFGSTVAGSLYDATKSYFSACVMVLICAVAGIAVSLAISAGDRKAGKQ